QESGKSLGTDVQQKKLTLPLIHLLRRGGVLSDDARGLLETPNERSVPRLRYLLAEAGAVGYALREAECFVQQAREQLKLLPESEAREILEYLTSQIVHRRS